MTEFDERTEGALTQLRASWEPPPGAEEPLLVAIHARLGTGPGGGEGGPGGEGGEGGPGTSGSGATGGSVTLGYAAKVVGATLGLSAAGLAGVALVGALVRGPSRAESPPDATSRLSASVSDGESERRASPPIVGDASPEAPAPPETFELVEANPRPTERTGAPASSDTTPASGRTGQPAAAPARAAPGPNLEAELALLREAKSAGNEDRLELLDRHERLFPDGTLASERDSLRIIALCELGRLDAARPRYERFVDTHPAAMQLPRLRAACSGLDPTSERSGPS